LNNPNINSSPVVDETTGLFQIDRWNYERANSDETITERFSILLDRFEYSAKVYCWKISIINKAANNV